ncbi:MAG: GyrI-like domain-containing protein [Cyclobacteriaceae bacterium]
MGKPKIIDAPERKLIGMRIKTSLSNDQTVSMWQRFMPRRKEIASAIDGIYYSVQVYPEHFKMADFTPETVFEKWAGIEVIEFTELPEGMESTTLASGKYAIFIHQGPMATFPKTLQYIYNTWLPQSGYELDSRPHFEIMGAKYKGPNDPNSEEEVWIPIR